MARDGRIWAEMQGMECDDCTRERERPKKDYKAKTKSERHKEAHGQSTHPPLAALNLASRRPLHPAPEFRLRSYELTPPAIPNPQVTDMPELRNEWAKNGGTPEHCLRMAAARGEMQLLRKSSEDTTMECRVNEVMSSGMLLGI